MKRNKDENLLVLSMQSSRGGVNKEMILEYAIRAMYLLWKFSRQIQIEMQMKDMLLVGW